MKKLISAILVLSMVLSLSACSAVPAAGQAPAEESYKLGVAIPLSGMGSSAAKMELVGITMAVDEINAAGGIGGKKLTFETVDTSGDPKEASNALRKLASENVLAVVGPHYTGEAEVCYPIGDELGLVEIALACSMPGLSDGYKYGFRNIATEDQIADKVLKKWIEDNDIKTVAIISDVKAAVARSIGEDILPGMFADLGVEVLTLDNPVTYQTGDVDFSAQITKVKALDPDGIALGSLAGDALNIIAKAREQGLTQSFVGTAPLLEGVLDKKGGEDTQGTYAGSAFCLTPESEKAQKFIEDYRKLAPTMYTEVSSDPLHYCANAYDAVYMIAEAIREQGVSGNSADVAKDRDLIRDYLENMKDFDGVNSKGFDENHSGIKDIYVLKIVGDQWVVAE